MYTGSLYCKISYLLAEEHWSHTNLAIWQPTYDSVCKDNTWIHGKCRQRFLSNVYKRFFLFSPRFLTFFNVFYFHLSVYYIYAVIVTAEHIAQSQFNLQTHIH